MKRLIFRLIIVLIILGAGWLIYNSDSFNCNGPKSSAWISSTNLRIQESVSDNNSSKTIIRNLVISSASSQNSLPPPLRMLTEYVDRAKSRYVAQQNQDTPGCLSNLQEKVTTAFYYDWKYYDAADNRNYQQAIEYANKFNTSLDEIKIEIDRLSAKYNK